MVKSKAPVEPKVVIQKDIKPLMPLIEQIEKYGKKGQGKNEYIRYLKTGKPLSRSAAMKAYCYGCMGFCADGQLDCGDKECPLYPFMPYTTVVRAPIKRAPRVLSDEHKKKLIDGRKKK